MFRIRNIIFTIVLVSWCENVSAYDGNQLAEICGETRGPLTSAIGCITYITGVVDTAMWERAVNYKPKPSPGDPQEFIDLYTYAINLYCPPDGVTPEQTMAVVRKRLRDNPSEWHLPAVRYVQDALREAFPCK